MQCTRCAGMKVPEIIVEGGARIFVMRCVHCGDVIDHVIAMNRQHRRYALPGRPEHRSMGVIGAPGVGQHG
jgi:uncharacterized Zn finger protein